MASYVDLIIKTNKGINFYDVNDPLLDELLHPDFFKIDTAHKFLTKILKGWENKSKKFKNAPFENRACLIDFTTKTIYNAKIFPLNEYFMLGLKHRMSENKDFKKQIEALFNEGYLNKVRSVKKNKKVFNCHKFKNFKEYEKLINKSDFKWVVVDFGEWTYKQVKTLTPIKTRINN